VSFTHLYAAAELRLQSPSQKLVLMIMAKVACDNCGLAWPGMTYLEETTALGRATIQRALSGLVASGQLSPRAYTTGGRGRATQYLVLPIDVPLNENAPCHLCRNNLKLSEKGLMVRPFGQNVMEKGPHGEAVSDEKGPHGEAVSDKGPHGGGVKGLMVRHYSISTDTVSGAEHPATPSAESHFVMPPTPTPQDTDPPRLVGLFPGRPLWKTAADTAKRKGEAKPE